MVQEYIQSQGAKEEGTPLPKFFGRGVRLWFVNTANPVQPQILFFDFLRLKAHFDHLLHF